MENRKIISSKKDTMKDIIKKIKEDNKLNEYLNNKNIQKKIFIPNKLINIITIKMIKKKYIIYLNIFFN